MRHRSIGLAGLVMLAASAVAIAAEDDTDRERVLGLVSMEYRLGGRSVPRGHDLEAYLALIESNAAPVSELAALSTLGELCALEYHRAFRARIGATEGLLGGLSPRPPGVNDQATDEQTRRQEQAARMVGPMQAAIRAGRLAAFQQDELRALGIDVTIPQAIEVGTEIGFRDSVRNIIAAQANEYRAQLVLTGLQAIVGVRAERLAQSAAGAGELADVEVVLRIERGRGYVVALRNNSGSDLHHVTLAALAIRTPVQGPTDADNRALGSAAARLGRERDPAEVRQQSETFARSAADFYQLRNLPVRILLHVPRLPAGGEATTLMVGSTAEMKRVESVTFSLWADEGRREGQPIGGMDELRAEMERNASLPPPNRRPGATANPLATGGNPAATPPRQPPAAPPARPQPPNPFLGSTPAAAGQAAAWLRRAQLEADSNPIQASGRFRLIASQFPKSPEAEEARAWLRDYPQLLVDRAGTLADDPATLSQAVTFYRQAATVKPGSEPAKAALAALHDLAPRLLALAAEKEAAGDVAGAVTLYRQILGDLPKSTEATSARARLRSLGNAGRGGKR